MEEDDTVYATHYHGEENSDGNDAEGYGTMRFSNGFKFTGVFIKGLPDGPGVLHYPDGRVFVGEVYGISPHGYGVMFGKKNDLGHQPFTFANFINGSINGMQVALDDPWSGRMDFSMVVENSVQGRGMRTSSAPGGVTIPNIFKIVEDGVLWYEGPLMKWEKVENKKSE